MEQRRRKNGMIWLVLLSTLLAQCAWTGGDGVAFPSDGVVCIGEDLYVRFRGIQGQLHSCTVINALGTVQQLFPPPTGPLNDSRIEYFDSGVEGERCGFRIRGVVKTDYGTWNLTATSERNSSSTEAGISAKDCPKGGDEAQYSRLPGENTRVQCGPQEMKACYAAHSPGMWGSGVPLLFQRVGRGAVCTTPNVPFNNLAAGRWLCGWSYHGDMTEKKSLADVTYTELPSDQDVGVEWSNATGAGRRPSVNLRCNVRKTTVELCRFVQPGGTVFYPSDGLASGRYSYFGSGLIEGHCGISVEQPLKPEDIGLWRCEVFLSLVSPWDMRGGYVEVGIATRTTEEKVKTLRRWISPRRATGDETLVAAAGDPIVLGCSAEASLTLCLIRQPDGNTVPGSRDTEGDGDSEVAGGSQEPYGRGWRLGDCGVRVVQSQVNHTGTWECVVGIDYGEVHALPIEVVVHENLLTAEVDNVYLGLPANFTCRSVTGVSLERCRFERPDRTIVTVMDYRHASVHSTSWKHGVKASGNMSSGVCTMHIPEVKTQDIGQWRCVARAEGSKTSLEVKFHVTEMGISAASVGVITGVIVILFVTVAIGVVVFFRKYKARSGRAVQARIAGPPANEEEGNDSGISFRRTNDEGSESSGDSHMEN